MLRYETVSKAKKVLLRAQHNDRIPNEDSLKSLEDPWISEKTVKELVAKVEEKRSVLPSKED